MKRLIFSILLASFCTLASAAIPRNTADFYKSDPLKWMGTPVTIYISDVKPSSFVAKDGYVSFHCWTAYQGERGGYIYALVKADKARAFGRDYSDVEPRIRVHMDNTTQKDGEVASKMAKGIFYKVKWENGTDEYVLIIN